MHRRYQTVDVFTDTLFGGNPLAVVLDAQGLSTAQMQAITREFDYSETTFILPPRDPAHTAHVRIFNPSREMPFAGHPNVGTAFVLARAMAARGEAVPERLLFEEGAGLVPVALLRDEDTVIGAELTAPEPLSRRAEVPAERAAAALALDAADIRVDAHQPTVASVGMPFLVVELASRDALRRVAPDPAAYDAVLPLAGAFSVYAYTRDIGANDAATDLQARMFTRRLTEDPATGSATGAAIALLAAVRNVSELALRVGQGFDMGRPSLMQARARRDLAGITSLVGGRCVPVMAGGFDLAGEDDADKV